MKDAEKIEYIRTILNIADALDVDRALALYISGIEPRGTAEWIMDETYNGKSKSIYVCSSCGHWQSIKKARDGQLCYMKYCPFCGSKME